MSNQLIDFESGSSTTGDSGERTTSTAIKPILSGEGVKSAVLDRPLENLRARTEEVRKSVEDLLYRADADKWIITGGSGTGAVTSGGLAAFPTVTWNATAGTFTVSAPIVIQPLMAPYRDIKGIGEGTHTYTITDSVPNTVTFTFYSRLFDYQLANQLRIIWEEADHADISGGYCEATLEGSPVHILRIVIRDDGMTQGTDIDTALSLILPATAVSHSMGSTGSTYVALSDITDPDFVIKGNYSRELHRLTDTELATFFATTALSVDGEGIGIWFEEIIDSDPLTFGGRRQSTPDTAPTPNTTVTASKLFLFTTESSKIHGAIPLCRRIGTYLVFVDGTVVANGETSQFGQQPWPILAHQTGSDAGNTLIGCDAVTDTPSSLVAGTQRAQTVELLGHVNDRATLVELAQVVDDRVKSYDMRSTDPGKMLSTGFWVESGVVRAWALPSDAANLIRGGGTKQYTDIKTFFTATGEPRLIVSDNTALKFQIWDPRVLTLVDTSDVLTDDLPAGSFDIQSICTDGVSVYATIQNLTPIPDEYYIQAWDIATWNVKSGWPLTGTKLTTTGNTIYFKGIVASATRLAVINTGTTITASNSPAVEIINIATGAIVAVGAGASTPTGSAVPNGACIATDGTYVYFGVYKSSSIYICNASIANPTLSSGGTGFGGSLGTDTYVSAAVSLGTYVLMFFGYMTSDKDDIVMILMDSTNTSLDIIHRGLLQSTHSLGADAFPYYNVGDAVFDGLNIWAFATVDLLGSGKQAALFRIDASQFCPKGSLDVERQIGDLNTSTFMLPLGHSGLGLPQMGITFDGRDVWSIQEHQASVTLSGVIARLPLALLRH